jgi:DNA-binding MarR family transcriptional regulator
MSSMAADRSPKPGLVEDNPGFALYRLGRAARREFATELRSRGLQPAHFGVLLALADQAAGTQEILSGAAGVDPTAIVALIDGLERQELVRRMRDPTDRRRNRVELTEAGRAVAVDLGQLAAAVNERFFAPLDREERDILAFLLEKLLRAHAPTSWS